MGGVKVFNIQPCWISEHYGVGFKCTKYGTGVSDLIEYVVMIRIVDKSLKDKIIVIGYSVMSNT